MLVEEVTEGVVSIFGRKGNKTVRKYRCTSGSRKGRIVSKPSTCTAPLNVKASRTLKATKHKKGATMKAKAGRTRRANPASRRLSKLNVGMRRIKPKRNRSKGRRI